MSKTYPSSPIASARLAELPAVSATLLKNSTADVLDRVSAGGAVAITRHEKPRAVLLPVDQYEALVAGQTDWLAELYEEYQGVLAEMQSPEQKAAALRLFEATSEELGAAAVRGAQRKAALSK